jgi:hypothetical protein
MSRLIRERRSISGGSPLVVTTPSPYSDAELAFLGSTSYAQADSLTSDDQFIELPELQIAYYSTVDATQPDQADAVAGTTINPV